MRNEKVNLIIGPDAQASVSDVMSLLPEFETKYPDGWSWLESKLACTGAGDTNLWLSLMDGAIVALAIESLKGAHTRKLSTFAVAPDYRRQGYGEALLGHLKAQWVTFDVDKVHVTVDEDDLHTQRFFTRNQFVWDEKAVVAYGNRGFDRVFRWRPDGA